MRSQYVFALTVAAYLAQGGGPAHGQAPTVLSPPASPVPATYFGMHNHEPLDARRRVSIPIGTYRLWDVDVNWPNLEPRRGQWQWARLDAIIALAEQQGWQVIMPLAFSPRWASARPDENAFNDFSRLGWSAEPADIEDWRNYVRTVVRRYKGRVHVFDVWNEPNNKNFYSGSISKLIELAREAYVAVKAEDPNATVISPAVAHNAGTGLNYLDSYLRQGGGAYSDVIGYHFYIDSDAPERLPQHIGSVRQVLERRGQGSKPLWNTEASWASNQILFASVEMQAAWLARAYLLNWASGVEQFDWYAWDNRQYPSIYLVEPNLQTPTRAAAAYSEVRRWLLGSRMRSAASDGAGRWVVELVRPDNTAAYVVWHESRSASLDIPAAWRATQVLDLSGAARNIAAERLEIGISPVLIATATRALAESYCDAVPAASLTSGPVAAGSLMTVFAEGLSVAAEAVRYLPWFETLADATVAVSDAAGGLVLTKVSYVGPGQLNVYLPGSVSPGQATLAVVAGDGVARRATIEIAPVAPSLFTANANGRGAPAAYVAVSGTAGEPRWAFRCGSEPGKCEPAVIPASTGAASAVIVLFGTGIRNAAASTVSVSVCGQTLRPTYSGAQGTYPGLDQVNVVLPQSLRGCGASTLTLTAGGIRANPVDVVIE